MNTLLQQLADIDPGISAGQAAEFRTASLAIAQRLHGEPTSLPLSLNDWWQWLDDEGYDRDTLALILSQMSTARIGAAAQRQLLSHLEQIGTEPEGLAKLFDHVQTLHPLLANDYASLETMALAEQQQLEATAGGMSTKATIGIAVGAFVTGGVAGGLFGYIYGKKKQVVEKSEQIEVRVHEDAARDARREEETLPSKLSNDAMTIKSKLLNDGMTKDQNEDYIKNEISGNSTSEIEGKLLRMTSIDVENYTDDLYYKHIASFKREFDDELEQVLEKNFINDVKDVKNKIEIEFWGNEYKDKDGLLADIFKNNINDEISAYQEAVNKNLPEYQEAVNTVKQGDWYKELFYAYKNNTYTATATKLSKEIRLAYKKSIQNEIDLAKKEAAKEAKSKTDSLLIDQSSLIDKEVRTLKTTLNKDIRKAAKDSEQEAEDDFIVIEETGAEIPK